MYPVSLTVAVTLYVPLREEELSLYVTTAIPLGFVVAEMVEVDPRGFVILTLTDAPLIGLPA